MVFSNVFNAREFTSPQELLLKLKEIFSMHCGVDIVIDFIDSRSAAKGVRTFAAMSGCEIEIKEHEGYYTLHITGNPCCG